MDRHSALACSVEARGFRFLGGSGSFGSGHRGFFGAGVSAKRSWFFGISGTVPLRIFRGESPLVRCKMLWAGAFIEGTDEEPRFWSTIL